MKLLKRNQVVVYSIAVLLMIAGYLNYSGGVSTKTVEASVNNVEGNSINESSNIGDARLVSSNDISQDDNTITQNVTTIQTSNSTDEDDYFAKSKLERDTMYSQMLETYENVLNSSNSLETQKQSATEQITKINEIKNSIMVSENLLQTKGFDKSVIFVNGNSISIIIGVEELEKEEVAQIQNIISREMEAQIENIHISTK